MPTDPPDYTPFEPKVLLALEPLSLEAEKFTQRLKELILSRLNILPEYEGAEEAVKALRSLGYPLSENVAQSRGYSYQAKLLGGARQFNIVGLSDWISIAYYAIETEDNKLSKMSKSERVAHLTRSEFWQIEKNLSDHSFCSLGSDDAQIIAIGTFVRELNNGGFEQYFDNTQGEQIDCLVASFTRVGATEALNILKRAIGIICTSTLSEPQKGITTPQSLTKLQIDQLNELDSVYYELTEDLELLAMRYRGDCKQA
jgi:hypothetical protein